MIKSWSHTQCRACDSELPLAFLDLGMQPLANNLCTVTDHCDDVFPMRLCRCSMCGLLQLDTVIDPAAMFSHYLYTPSQSQKTLAHFESLADTATSRVRKVFKRSLDIGSNDGALIGMLMARGWIACGVDPAENLARQANAVGLPTIVGFFDDDAVKKVEDKYGQVDLITANNVFAHSPDWEIFARCTRRLLAKDGLLAIEFPYGPFMLNECMWDLCYWEHASYPMIGPVAHLFSRHGMYVQDVEYLPGVHGGSVRVWVGHEKWANSTVDICLSTEVTTASVVACENFVVKVQQSKQQLIAAVRSNQGRVFGFTAPAKCVTLLVATGLDVDDVGFIIDDNPLKQGRMLPKLHIPIVSPKDVRPVSGDTAVIFAWNVAEDIMVKLPDGVDAIIPMPHVRMVRR